MYNILYVTNKSWALVIIFSIFVYILILFIGTGDYWLRRPFLFFVFIFMANAAAATQSLPRFSASTRINDKAGLSVIRLTLICMPDRHSEVKDVAYQTNWTKENYSTVFCAIRDYHDYKRQWYSHGFEQYALAHLCLEVILLDEPECSSQDACRNRKFLQSHSSR